MQSVRNSDSRPRASSCSCRNSKETVLCCSSMFGSSYTLPAALLASDEYGRWTRQALQKHEQQQLETHAPLIPIQQRDQQQHLPRRLLQQQLRQLEQDLFPLERQLSQLFQQLPRKPEHLLPTEQNEPQQQLLFLLLQQQQLRERRLYEELQQRVLTLQQSRRAIMQQLLISPDCSSGCRNGSRRRYLKDYEKQGLLRILLNGSKGSRIYFLLQQGGAISGILVRCTDYRKLDFRSSYHSSGPPSSRKLCSSTSNSCAACTSDITNSTRATAQSNPRSSTSNTYQLSQVGSGSRNDSHSSNNCIRNVDSKNDRNTCFRSVNSGSSPGSNPRRGDSSSNSRSSGSNTSSKSWNCYGMRKAFSRTTVCGVVMENALLFGSAAAALQHRSAASLQHQFAAVSSARGGKGSYKQVPLSQDQQQRQGQQQAGPESVLCFEKAYVRIASVSVLLGAAAAAPANVAEGKVAHLRRTVGIETRAIRAIVNNLKNQVFDYSLRLGSGPSRLCSPIIRNSTASPSSTAAAASGVHPDCSAVPSCATATMCEDPPEAANTVDVAVTVSALPPPAVVGDEHYFSC